MFAAVLKPWRRSSTWWTLTRLTTDVLVGLVTFAIVAGLLVVTLGLAVTVVLAVLAIPMFWLLLVSSRGLARLERSRFSALLDIRLPDPVPPLRSDSWWQRLLERTRSGARWKEVAYLLVLFPLGVFNLLVTLTVWCGALALFFLPIYVSALPDGVAKFFLFDVGGGIGVAGIAFVGALGVLLIAPWATVLLGRFDVVVARSLLGPDLRAEQERRVRLAEAGRVAAVTSAEAERRRIERDLHDGAQQRLVTLAMDLGAARERFDSDPDGARELIGRAHDGAMAALEEIRDLVRGIHPAILEDRGLDAALSALVARARVPVLLEVDVAVRPRDLVESTAYFIVSEALTNVTRHSGATNAAVSLVRTGDLLTVEIRDNGRGGADLDAGTGLAGLRDRVASLGGELSLTSPIEGPTVLRAVLPCA